MMVLLLIFFLFSPCVQSVSTIACSSPSTSVQSISVRWNVANCVGSPSSFAVFDPGSPVCVGSREDGGAFNQIAFQVCSSNVSAPVVCPVVQAYLTSDNLPQSPPTNPASLTCNDITISSTATIYPVEGGSDFAFPERCYNLPGNTGSVQYFCGIDTVPPVFLGNSSSMTTAPASSSCNATAAIQVCSPSVLTNSSTWYQLRNDTCNCPWNCIDCHRNGIVTPFSGKTLAEEHRCACASTTMTADCRGCTATGCGDGAVCDTSVYVSRNKVFQCSPSQDIAAFFQGGGLFVWEIEFPDAVTSKGGTASLSCYASPIGTPLLFTCDFSNCDKGVENNNFKLSCETTKCTPTGGGDATLNNVVNGLFGLSYVILEPSGRTTMNQQEAPISVIMNCNASACQFPGESVIKQSTLELALATAFGVGIIVLLGVLILICVIRSRKLEKDYSDFGTKRIERTIEWSNMACTLRFYIPSKTLRRTKKVLEVLKPMSGVAAPGTMLSIMGESGSGKTALLDMLARRKTFGEMHGEVLVDGRIPGREWKRISGYVLQDDVFIPTQTAREHLQFVSRLKLPANMRSVDRDARVDAVLKQMHLEHIADSQIGDSRRKGLSGGEKKRLAIAAELISDPAVLFLDEPTSGLDSVNAHRVMQCLSVLAKERGKTIIFSIHAPDSALFQLFTNIIILAKGHLMYSGTRDGLLPAMEKLSGISCPMQYNPADFAIHVIAKIPEEELPMKAGLYLNQRNVTGDSNDIDKAFSADAVEMNLLSSEAGPSNDPLLIEEGMVNVDTMQLEKEKHQRDIIATVDESERLGTYNQSWLWQVFYVMKRSLADSWRNPYLLRLQYFLIIAAALVLGGMFFQMGVNLAGAQNRAGLLFFVVAFLMIITLPSIDTFYAERTLFLREKGAGYYSPSSYFVAKALADVIPLRLLPPIILSAIVYPMAGLRSPINYYFWFMLLCILVSYCATGMCLLISTLSPSVGVGNLVAIIAMMFTLLFGGLLLNTSTLPPGLAWIKWISFLNYAWSAMMINEFVNLTFFISALNQIYPVPGQYFLTTIFGVDFQFYLYIYLLVAMGTVFYIASVITLYFVQEKR